MEEIRCLECVYPRATDPCCTVNGAPLCHAHAVHKLATMSRVELAGWFWDEDNWSASMSKEEAFEMVQLAEMGGVAK